MNKVLIMMSTYNGQKYIREQLDSLYNQKDVDIHILVRDDGSKDNTLQILKEYKLLYGRMTILEEPNIGTKKSFHSLIIYAKENFADFDYFAFCDQDDYWLPEKLKVATESLNKLDEKYKMYFCSMSSVDSTLTPIHTIRDNKVINNLYANIATGRIAGCTQVFNYEVLYKANILSENIIKKNDTSVLPYHDWWVASVSYSLSDKVIYDKQSYILYRQHDNNVVGSQRNGLMDRFKRFINTQNRLFRAPVAKKLLSYIGQEVTPSKKEFLYKISTYQDSLYNTIKLMFDRNIYQYPFDISFPLFWIILLRKF